MRGSLSHLRRFLRREDGTATLEFVILFPLFMMLFISSVELGILSLRNVMMERALDLNVRALRLGIGGTPTHDQIKQQICRDALIIPDCANSLRLEMSRVDLVTFTGLDAAPDCVDRAEEGAPALNFTPGLPNDLMLIRACTIFDPIFPTAGLANSMALNPDGTYALVATSAYVVEPL